MITTLGKAEAALAEIIQLIAENKFSGHYLIGMIDNIAKHGPTSGGEDTKEALALIRRLHRATREFDALYCEDCVRYGPAYETTADISAAVDELTTLLGLSIDEAWAPVLADEGFVTAPGH
jgi:hypothetical protein